MTYPLMTLGFQPADQAAWRGLTHAQRQEAKKAADDEIRRRFPLALAARWSGLDDLPVDSTDFHVDESGVLWDGYVPLRLKELSAWITQGGPPDYSKTSSATDLVRLHQPSPGASEECVYYTFQNGQRVCHHCWPVEENVNGSGFRLWTIQTRPAGAAADVTMQVYVELHW